MRIGDDNQRIREDRTREGRIGEDRLVEDKPYPNAQCFVPLEWIWNLRVLHSQVGQNHIAQLPLENDLLPATVQCYTCRPRCTQQHTTSVQHTTVQRSVKAIPQLFVVQSSVTDWPSI